MAFFVWFRNRFSELVFLGLVGIGTFSPEVHAQVPSSVRLGWRANTEPNLAGYHIYYGPATNTFTNRVTVGPFVTNALVGPLVPGANYWLAMTAFNTDGLESLPTRSLFYKAPSTPLLTNTPPVFITPILDQKLIEDYAGNPVNFSISDAESLPSALTVRARSSNTRLVPNEYILLGGTGSQRSFMIVPQLDQWGTADITLEVRDPQGASNTINFQVVVESVNDQPVLSPIGNLTIQEDGPTAKLPFFIFDAETPPAELWMVALSSDQTVIPDENIAVLGTASSRVLTVTPPKDAYGTTIIDLYMVDSEGDYAWIWFAVAVTSVNDRPTLDPIPNFNLNEDSGPVLVSLSGISSGANNEAQQLTVSATSSHPHIVPHPQVNYVSPNNSGSVVIAPLPDTNGTALITVSVVDGQAVNGTNTQSFAVTVRPFNNPPVILGLPERAILQAPKPLQIVFTVMDAETPASALMVTAESTDPAALPDSNLILTGIGSQRVLTITPVLGRTGLVTIRVSVSDGQATVSWSFDVMISLSGI